MQGFFVAVLICLISTAVLAGSWETSSFRTPNGQLIRPGMTKAEVRRNAGAPLEHGKATRVKDKGSSTGKHGKRGEVWTYQGSDGIYSLSFTGDRLARIEVAPFRGH